MWRGGSDSSTPSPGRGGGGARGGARGRGAAGSRGAGAGARSSNLSWRPPPLSAHPTTLTPPTEEQSQDDNDNDNDSTRDSTPAAPAPPPSAFPAFGSNPNAFGTPAFSGGQSAFGNGGLFGGGAASNSTTSAFGAGASGSAFGTTSKNTGFGTSAFGGGGVFGKTLNTSTSSAFTPAVPPPKTTKVVAAAPPPTTKTTFVPAPPPSTNQISTLEVLGEDSDARRKRFESSLANNRFLELKPLREAQRARDIKAGLIPDPLKPMRLDQATDFLGTCEDMCPEWEREEREYQNNVDLLERYPGTTRIDPTRAVKAFHRPAAGNDQPLPSDVRPPHILKSTLDYLFHTLLPTAPLHVTHPFLRDRTRAIRQDFTMQNERGVVAIECNERIARYHVLALGTLREQSGFSESQELEQLRKVLKSLNEFYDDARSSNPPIPTPNEAEFRSYNVLTHLRDPDIIWSCELLPPQVFNNPLFQTALSLHRLVQRSNLARGERASPSASSRFFKLVSQAQVPYLFGCILSTHFAEIRKFTLEAMKNAYLHQHSLFPARTLAKMLGCDNESEVVSICESLGLGTKVADNGKLVVELYKAATMKNGTIKPKVSLRLVEAKRGSTTYQQVIDNAPYSVASVDPIPPTPSLNSTATFFASPASTIAPKPQPPPLTSIPPSRTFPAAAPTNGLSAFSSPFAPSTTTTSAFSQPTTKPAATFSSPIPTPVPTPPPSFPPPASLNPIAPSFVPSSSSNNNTLNPFSQPTPPTRPTLAVFQPAPPPSTLPSSTASPDVPPSAPPIVIPTISQPDAQRPTKRLPPTTIPTLSSSSSSPRKTSLISVVVPPPSSPLQNRQHLIKVLVTSLTTSLLTQATHQLTLRIVEKVLQERWSTILQHQHAVRKEWSRRLMEGLVKEFVERSVREVVVSLEKEKRVRREVLEIWEERLVERREGRRRERERRKRFGKVVKDIGVAKGDGGWSEDEVEDGEEDGMVVNGGGEVDVDLEGLSLGGGLMGIEERDKVDQRMVDKLRQAETNRLRIWSPGTFLDLISHQIDSSFHRLQLGRRHSWSTIVSTTSNSSAFASWLACKFDLSVDADSKEMVVEIDTPEVDLDVVMVGEGTLPSSQILDHAGLIVFDYTGVSDDVASITTAQQRLQKLVEATDRQSLYEVRLLVVYCPPTSIDSDAAKALQSKILANLNVAQLLSVSNPTVLLVRLEDAEDQLADVLNVALPEVVIRPGRVLTPLSHPAEALLKLWSDSLRQSSTALSNSSPHDVANAFIGTLNVTVEALRTLATPKIKLKSLPSLSTPSSSFREELASYIQRPEVASGNFAFLEAALVERPPVPDYRLARLLVEHLAAFVVESVARATARVEDIEQGLSPAKRRLSEALVTSTTSLAPPPPQNVIKLSAPQDKKKRKASISPTEVSNHKKQLVEEEDPRVDARGRLNALDALIRDASKLLAR